MVDGIPTNTPTSDYPEVRGVIQKMVDRPALQKNWAAKDTLIRF
jgi:hypothetical protein